MANCRILERCARASALMILAAPWCPAQEGDPLPLPEWGDYYMESGGSPGAMFNNLLPPPTEVQSSMESGPRLEDALPELQAGYSELSPHDLALFLHGSVLKPGAPPPPTHEPMAAAALRDFPREMLEQAYQSQAGEYLIDPQGLVSEVLKTDLQRLLEFHASDARVKLFVLVMDGNQKLPEGARLDQVAQGILTRQDACLSVYPLGEPWRVRFLVSKSVHEAAPAHSLTELAEDCTQDALKAADSGQQLQRFAIRLSTRLFWLEKNLPAPVAHRPAPLQEVTQHPAPSAAPDAGGNGWVTAVALGGLLAMAGTGAWFVRHGRNRRSQDLRHVWMLPDMETMPRLGGNFSGGTSAVIHYGPRHRTGC